MQTATEIQEEYNQLESSVQKAINYFNGFRWEDHLNENNPGFGNMIVYLATQGYIEEFKKYFEKRGFFGYFSPLLTDLSSRLEQAYNSVGNSRAS